MANTSVAAAMMAARTHDPSRPGKFENEPEETVYFYTLGMLGEAHEAVGPYMIFKPAPCELRRFKLDGPHFIVYQDDLGSVYGWDATEQNVIECRASEVI